MTPLAAAAVLLRSILRLLMPMAGSSPAASPRVNVCRRDYCWSIYPCGHHSLRIC
jgi:hypothetical protein